MKILVIGSKGQVGHELGAALTNCLSNAGCDPCVTLFDRNDLNLSCLSGIAERLSEVEPDLIVNAAAYTAVDRAESEIDLTFTINTWAVAELAKYCRFAGCALIHISTDYVFDGELNRPYREEDLVGAVGVYGRSKLEGESRIRELLSNHIILRTSWVFGGKGNNFVKTMLRLSDSNDQVRVVSDQVGSPTASRSIADAIALIAVQIGTGELIDSHWGTYHFSGWPYCSWAFFATEIFEQSAKVGLIEKAPKVIPIRALEYPTPAARPGNSRLDCSKLKSTFGIEPDDWKTSLGLVLDELKEGMQS